MKREKYMPKRHAKQMLAVTIGYHYVCASWNSVGVNDSIWTDHGTFRSAGRVGF